MGATLKILLRDMLHSEFIQRTGVEVSNYEFDAINEVYMNSDLDKDEFCKVWCKMNASRVNRAKAEKKVAEAKAARNERLQKWFHKYDKSKYFFDNYHTLVCYCKLTSTFLKDLAVAGIRIKEDENFSDLHFEVGQYLGIYA